MYVDKVKSTCIEVERTRPAICYWTTDKMKVRETYECEVLGAFGTGDINEDFVEDDLNEEVHLS